MCTLRKTCSIAVSKVWTLQSYIFVSGNPLLSLWYHSLCSKRMRRLAGVRSFYIRWRIHCIQNHTQMLSGFPYGRTQHVRHMHSSIVSYHLSMQYFICHVMWPRTSVIFQVTPIVPFYCNSETLLWLRSF